MRGREKRDTKGVTTVHSPRAFPSHTYDSLLFPRLTWENVVLLKIHLKGSSASEIPHMHINNTHFVVPRVVFNEAS